MKPFSFVCQNLIGLPVQDWLCETTASRQHCCRQSRDDFEADFAAVPLIASLSWMEKHANMLHAGITLLLSAVRAVMGSVRSYEAGILGAEASSENPPLCVTDAEFC